MAGTDSSTGLSLTSPVDLQTRHNVNDVSEASLTLSRANAVEGDRAFYPIRGAPIHDGNNKENNSVKPTPFTTRKSKKAKRSSDSSFIGPNRSRDSRTKRRTTFRTPYASSRTTRSRPAVADTVNMVTNTQPSSADSSLVTDTSLDEVEVPFEGDEMRHSLANARAKELTELPLADITAAYEQAVFDWEATPFADEDDLAASL